MLKKASLEEKNHTLGRKASMIEENLKEESEDFESGEGSRLIASVKGENNRRES